MIFAKEHAIAWDVKKWIRRLYHLGCIPIIQSAVKQLRRELRACNLIYTKEQGILTYSFAGKAKDKIRIHTIMVNPLCPDRTVGQQMLGQLVEIAKKNAVKQIYLNVRDNQHESLRQFAKKYMSEGERQMATGYKDVWYTTYYINLR